VRVDGDTGLPTGEYLNGKFSLSLFDGARAQKMEISRRRKTGLSIESARPMVVQMRIEARCEVRASAGSPSILFGDTTWGMIDPTPARPCSTYLRRRRRIGAACKAEGVTAAFTAVVDLGVAHGQGPGCRSGQKRTCYCRRYR